MRQQQHAVVAASPRYHCASSIANTLYGISYAISKQHTIHRITCLWLCDHFFFNFLLFFCVFNNHSNYTHLKHWAQTDDGLMFCFFVTLASYSTLPNMFISFSVVCDFDVFFFCFFFDILFYIPFASLRYTCSFLVTLPLPLHFILICPRIVFDSYTLLSHVRLSLSLNRIFINFAVRKV